MFWIVAGVALAQEGLFSKVVAAPTGRNGFEEYVRAAERVDIEPVRRELARTEGGVLARNKWVLERYGSVLELVRQGNGKPVVEPRPNPDDVRRFPEYNAFRTLSQTLNSAAYAEFAAGKTEAGVDRLLQSLTMWQNVGGTGTILAQAYGMIHSRSVLDAFDARLGQLSLSDCRRIDGVATDLLRKPATTGQMYRNAMASALRVVDKAAANPQAEKDSQMDVLQALSKLTGEELQRFRRAAAEEIRTRYEPLIRASEGPEAQWPMERTESEPFRPGGDPEEVARGVVDAITGNYRGTVIATAQMRTQLRLLRLHARVLAFRWEHDRLPMRLEEASRETADPLTGGTFEYERMETGYRLFSRGRPETGVIALKSANAPFTAPPAEP
jgi:hypothetical protein